MQKGAIMSRQKVADAKKVLKSKGGKPVAYTNPYS